MRAVITGTGMYVPPTVVDNHRLSRIMDTTDEWIRVRTGIATRRYADPDSASSDLAVPAALQAISNAGLEPRDVDYVVFATMTPDQYFPGSGPHLQRKLGLRTVPCLDIRQQCAGFIFGLQVADAVVRSGQARQVLVIGAEVHTSFMPWPAWDRDFMFGDHPIPPEDFARNTATRDRTILFGDGAGAVVVSGTDRDDLGVLDVLIHTDGNEVERLCTRAGGSAYRPYFSPDMVATGDITPFVDGREVFRLAVRLMPQVVLELLERNRLTLDDVDLVIMHQANLRINEGVQKRLGLPDDKVFNNIQRYGNTTAGTIPIAFHEALAEGRVRAGNLICFVGLGSGLNWGAVLYRCP
jgi:3-oxoacyl-[acyl-carrier-protein] synthase III